jgi:hypothetical protein
MMQSTVEIHVQDSAPWGRGLSVWLVDRHQDGKVFVAPPVVFTECDPGETSAPSFAMSQEAAQELMNRMWQLGIRPRDGEGTMAHVGAMKAHIEDLRKVAFSHHDTCQIAR